MTGKPLHATKRLRRILGWRLRDKSRRSDPELMLAEVADITAHRARIQATEGERRKRQELEHQILAEHQESFHIHGECWTCGNESDFLVDLSRARRHGDLWVPNWRETVKCQSCGLNNRLRASLHLFHHQCTPAYHDRIYITEQTTPIYHWLRERYRSVTGSEYLGDKVPLGKADDRGLRNESLTRLSFPDDAFDHLLSFDVLEHVPRWQDGLAECFRCLKPGGWLMLSVPFLAGAEATRVRARLLDNGEVEHILPPEYHGDPMKDSGCLCFYHFGWDLLDALSDIGFIFPHAAAYWSRTYCYLGGEQLVFFAQKPFPRFHWRNAGDRW